MSRTVSDDVRLGHGHRGSVDLSVTDHVATVTMRCGENRLNTNTIGWINDALDKVESDPEVQVLLLTGEGRFFSAGIDLPWMKNLGQTNRIPELKAFMENQAGLRARVLTFPMPTVAVINGHAAAAGALLALACDVRIMRKDRGFFYINEVHLGIKIQGFGRALTLTKIPQGFTEAVVLGRRLTGPDTLRLGITRHLCEHHELHLTAHQTALRLLSDGPYDRKSFSLHKQLLYADILNADKKMEYKKDPEEFFQALSKAKM